MTNASSISHDCLVCDTPIWALRKLENMGAKKQGKEKKPDLILVSRVSQH